MCFYKKSLEIIPTQSMKDFKINEVPNFLNFEECDDIVRFIEMDVIARYKENNKMFWRNLQDNENMNAMFGRVNVKLRKLFNTIINKTYHMENLEIGFYETGNTCQHHYDACNGYVQYCDHFDKEHGPRQISIIIYLNDEFQGGNTYFRKINKNIKPERGKLVWFENYNSNNQFIIDETEHCGDVVRDKKKYICVTWIRYPHKER